MSDLPMLEVTDASKWFGDVVAVSEVSFALGPGVTALLGPNGAGKSTLLRMICGLTPTSRGSVRVLGSDPRTDLAVRGRIGIVPQQEAVFDPLNALEFVRLAAVLHGITDADHVARAALHLVELDPDDPRKVTGYSKGMRQRVKVAQALVNDPAVMVLDEPLTGLDPRQRKHLIDLFARLAAGVIASNGINKGGASVNQGFRLARAHRIRLPLVTVGNPGNPKDTQWNTERGQVAYTYQISKLKVRSACLQLYLAPPDSTTN